MYRNIDVEFAIFFMIVSVVWLVVAVIIEARRK